MGNSNLGYFLIALIVLFAFAIVSTNIFGLYHNTDVANTESLLGSSSFYAYFTNGFASGFVSLQDVDFYLFGFEVGMPFLNPFALLGTTAKTYVSNSLIALTYYPDAISIPFLIILVITFIIFIIKLFLP
jgi:hypothetical protein